MELIEIFRAWGIGYQFTFVIITSFLMTYLTEVVIKSFSRDFMNALTILIRGWPPNHVEPDDDDDDSDNDEDLSK